jgi:hypothetical protein
VANASAYRLGRTHNPRKRAELRGSDVSESLKLLDDLGFVPDNADIRRVLGSVELEHRSICRGLASQAEGLRNVRSRCLRVGGDTHRESDNYLRPTPAR